VSSADLPPSDEPGSFDMRDVLQLLEQFQRASITEAAVDDGNALPAALAKAAKRVLGVDGAAISLMTGPSLRLPLGASDEESATAERLQFTAGEGPCFTAYAQGRPVVVTEARMAGCWPRAAAAERLQFTAGEGPCFTAYAQGRPVVVTEARMAGCWPVLAVLHLQATPFRGGLSVPLHVDGNRLGVLDLYLNRSRPVDGHEILAAQMVAAHVAEVLLETLTGVETVDVPTDRPHLRTGWLNSDRVRERRDVWVAVGMTNLALQVPSPDALSLLRGRAVAQERTLDALAHDVVFGHLDVAELQQ
jgi:hypothetical protein